MAGVFLLSVLDVCVSCSSSSKPERLAYYVDVAEKLPKQVKRIEGCSYTEITERFGLPDYAYYYSANNVEDADTVIVPVVVALWNLGTSSYASAQDIIDEVMCDTEEMSGVCSVDLVINFKIRDNELYASQVTLE